MRKNRNIPEMIQAIIKEDSSVIHICAGPNALNLALIIMGAALEHFLDEFKDFKIVPLDKNYQEKIFTELLCAERLEDTKWIQIEKIDGEHTHTMWIWR